MVVDHEISEDDREKLSNIYVHVYVLIQYTGDNPHGLSANFNNNHVTRT